MRRAVLAAIAVLAGCKAARDPALAELPAPTRAVVRAHEEEVPVSCSESGLKRISCWFRSERQGCLYLEVGAAADAEGPVLGPERGHDGELCDAFPDEGDRLLLRRYRGHAERASLVADGSGERLAWRGAGPWQVVYLLDGEIVGASSPSGRPGLNSPFASDDELADDESAPQTVVAPVDWAATPTLEEAAPDLLERLPGDRQGRVVAAVRARAGDEGLLRLMKDATPSSSWWQLVFDQLDEDGQQRAVARLRTLVETDDAVAGEPGVLEYFTEHPEHEPANYAELLVRQLERGLDTAVDPSDTETFLDELVRRVHPRAGELACRSLGAHLAEELMQSDLAQGLAGLDPTALHALAAQKTPCPWVEIALLRNACSLELRCTPAGVPEASDQYYEGPVSPRQNALCPLGTVLRRLGKWPRDDAVTPMPGLELLAAAYAQGPLPREVLVRNARRQYRVVGRSPPRPDDDDEQPPPDSACDALMSSPEELACMLPLTTAEVTVGGCRVRVDDERQTLRLDDVRARKTSLTAGEGPLELRHHPD